MSMMFFNCNKLPPLDATATDEAEKDALKRRLILLLGAWRFNSAEVGVRTNAKRREKGLEEFLPTPEACSAMLEILLSTYDLSIL